MPGFRDQDRSCQFVLGDAEGFAQLDGARRGASAGFGNLHDVVFREACGCSELLVRSVVALLDEKLKRFGDGIEIRGYKYRPDFFKGYFQGIGKLHSRRVRAAAMERDRIHGDRVEAVDLAEMVQRLVAMLDNALLKSVGGLGDDGAGLRAGGQRERRVRFHHEGRVETEVEGDEGKLIRAKDLALEHVLDRGHVEAKLLTEHLNGEASFMQGTMNDQVEVVGGINREPGTVQLDGRVMNLLTVDGVERIQSRQFKHGATED